MKLYLFIGTILSINAATASASQDLVNFNSVTTARFWSPALDSAEGGSSTVFMQILPSKIAEISGTLAPGAGDSLAHASYQVSPSDSGSWNLQSAQKNRC